MGTKVDIRKKGNFVEHSKAPYRVSFAGNSKQQLNALRAEAIRLGIDKEFASAAKWIHERLTTAPLEWGDPLYRLRYLELNLYRGTHAPLNVIYAVDEQRRLVYLTQVWPMPGRGYTPNP